MMFIRLSLTFTITVFIQFMILFVIDEYIEYQTKLEEGEKIDQELLERIKEFTKYFEWIITATTVCGFIIFIMHRYKKRGKRFNIFSHMVGDMKCKND